MSDDDLLKHTQKKLDSGHDLVANKQYEQVMHRHGYRFDSELSRTHTHENVDVWSHVDGHEISVHPTHGWHHIEWPSEETAEGRNHITLDGYLTRFHSNLHESQDDVLSAAHDSLSQIDDNNISSKLITNKSISHQALDNLLTNAKTASMAAAIAQHPNVHPDTLHRMITDNSLRHVTVWEGVARSVAANPNTHPDTLALLRGHSHTPVRLAVANNPNTHPDTLKRLTLDWDRNVVHCAQTNPNHK